MFSLSNNDIYISLINTIPAFSITLTIALALVLDRVLGEAKHFHYLVGFGWLANQVERHLNLLHYQRQALKAKCLGFIAWSILVIPIPLAYYFISDNIPLSWQLFIDALILYLALGLKSLHQHATQVYQPLMSNNLDEARHFTGYLVSRETSDLTPQEMSRATVESMLENGHDAVIATLIYYLIGGAPLVILHRLANTLDAMWGYKNQRFINFGYASARLDDLLGFVSGKCCTLLYALQGIFHRRFTLAIINAYQQGNQYKSHNGGWVMAAGATVMNRKLGGSAYYHGKKVESVTLGCGSNIEANDILKSVKITHYASLLLLTFTFIFQLIAIN